MLLAPKILNDSSLTRKFLKFLESQNLDDSVQKFLTEVKAACENLGEITDYEKPFIQQFLSKIYLKLPCLLIDEDPHNSSVINDLKTIERTILKKPSRHFPLYDYFPAVKNEIVSNLLSKIPENSPPCIYTESNHVLLFNSREKFFMAGLGAAFVNTKYSELFFGIDASMRPVVIKKTTLVPLRNQEWDQHEKILKQLSEVHVNVLNHIDFFKEGHSVFFVFPTMGFFYAPNSKSVWKDMFDCFANTEKTPLKMSLAKHYFSVLVDVVKTLHEKSIFHRDLKTENACLDDYGRLKLTDFEFATDAVSSSEDQTLGTFGFLNPLIGEGIKNAQLDFWALGATLFALYANETLTISENLKENTVLAYGQLGIDYAQKKLHEKFPSKLNTPEENKMKQIINFLTISKRKDVSDADVLKKVSQITDDWRLSDESIIALLIQFSKARRF